MRGKTNRHFKFLALILAVAMVVGVIPMTTGASTESKPDVFTVTVKSNNETAIEGAEVYYQIKLDGGVTNDGTVTTDEKGEAAIRMTDYTESIAEGKSVAINYTASKEGYTSKSEEVAVTDTVGNVDIVMTAETTPEPEPEMVTVTVNKSGNENGTVTLTAGEAVSSESLNVVKGTSVTVKAEPEEGKAFVKTVKIDGAEDTVGNPSSYEKTITPEADCTISVEFGDVYTVSVKSYDKQQGTVMLNGEEKDSITANDGSNVTLAVTPADGYQIGSVQVNGNEKTISDKSNYAEEITVTEAQEITVIFIKVYTVKVIYDSEKGAVTAVPALDASGIVVIDPDVTDKINITATPATVSTADKNYRVSKIVVTSDEEMISSEELEGDKYTEEAVTREFPVEGRDLTIEITFAPVVFSVTVVETQNGTVEVNSSVNYGDDLTIYVKPDDGFSIASLDVNGKSVKLEETASDYWEHTVSKVTGDVIITAEFETIKPQTMDGIIWNINDDNTKNDPIRIKGGNTYNTYIFANNEQVKIHSEGQNILVVYTDENGNESTRGSKSEKHEDSYWIPKSKWENKDTVYFGSSESCTIEKIYTRSFFGNPWDTQLVAGSNFRIVFDITTPEVTIENGVNADGFLTASDSKLIVKVEDPGDYSGLEIIDYWVTDKSDNIIVPAQPEPVEGETTTEPAATSVPVDVTKGVQSKSFEVTLPDGIADNVVLHVKTADQAGNKAENLEIPIYICKTAPTMEVKISGSNHGGAAGQTNYYTSATATITINDAAYKNDAGDCFDENAANEDIVIIATDATGKAVKFQKSINWTHNGNTHTGSISFPVDAYYTLNAVYTSKSGLSTSSLTRNFWIDSEKAAIILVPDEAETDKAVDNETVYARNVSVNVQLKDSLTGFQKVEWKVIKDKDEENPTQSGTFSNTGFLEINESIPVDSSLNDSCDVVVVVTATDKSGNVTTDSCPLDIDVTPPAIGIAFNGTNSNKDMEAVAGLVEDGYYTEASAVVTITERNHHFNKDDVVFNVTAKTAPDEEGKAEDVSDAYTVVWEEETGEPGDTTAHKATVTFNKDANYTFSVDYTDLAGNAGTTAETDDFTVDTTQPDGTITAETAEGRKADWSNKDESLVKELTFGFWSREGITVTGTSEDATSPVHVKYYKAKSTSPSNQITLLTEEELNKISAWTDFTDVSITGNEQCTIYLKVYDDAGNYRYLWTNGLIVDNTPPVDDQFAPVISVQPLNDIYRTDVTINVSVEDPVFGGTYSGLKNISYYVYNMGAETQKDEAFFSFTIEDPKQSDLVQLQAKDFVVQSALNNSNEVEVKITAEDNAGNRSEKTLSLKIDITAPTVSISYNNNAAENSKYFKADRTATIVITERNFDPAAVQISMTSSNGTVPAVVGWSESVGTGNRDNTTHTATISYTADADYTFRFTGFSDMAGNPASSIAFTSDTVAGEEFTIDKTPPVINVVYDNNDAQNGNYYKEERNATVTITEHNFGTDRLTVSMSATDNGEAIAVPAVNGWSVGSDDHTATIAYTEDGRYTFDIDFVDLAGNAAADYAGDEFYVDKTAPVIEITGVEDKSANNGDIIPVITLTDTNFNGDAVKVVLDGVNSGRNLSFANTAEDIANGRTITYSNFEKVKDVDDLYTLTVTMTDMAGNETKETITFSANRFGSVYDLSKVKDLMNKYHQEGQELVITETNVDPLDKKSIRLVLTKNGTPVDLVEGRDYTMKETGGDGKWSQYQYTIHKDLFEEDGTYSLSLYSKDKAGNVNDNNDEAKGAEVTFGIDKTAPVIIPADFENGKQYAVATKTVSLEIKDNLVLDNVRIFLNGAEVPYTADGETFTFDIPEDTRLQNAKIIATDAAGNETEIDVTNFLVSTSALARWYNNKPLFGGSIAGIAAAAGIIIFAAGKRRKKKEEAA